MLNKWELTRQGCLNIFTEVARGMQPEGCKEYISDIFFHSP
jgi:hypothetical protein